MRGSARSSPRKFTVRAFWIESISNPGNMREVSCLHALHQQVLISADRAMSFWQYQIHQEKYGLLPIRSQSMIGYTLLEFLVLSNKQS